jgi:NAD(P)-dependent dehydrogenase (short-subunit alcohol dehydrogenase family)
MANLLFTYELARRLEPTGVTANAVHPGVTRSNLMKEAPLPIRWFSYLLSASPEKAADTPIYLASSPDVAGITGKFFKDRKVIESNQYSRDEGVQRHLWGVSAALVGLV